jgi:hypothetical protein
MSKSRSASRRSRRRRPAGKPPRHRAQLTRATPVVRRAWHLLGSTPPGSIGRSFWRLVLIVVGFFMVSFPIDYTLDAELTHGIHRRGDFYVADLRAMSDFDLDQVNGRTSDIPQAFRDLDGKRVMLSGQMWSPLGAAGKLHGFDLVYSISNCCFMGPPKVQHFVHASLPPGRTVDFSGGQVIVTGKLNVGVESSGGVVQSVYRINVEDVQPN